MVFTVYHRATGTAFVLAEGPNKEQHWRHVQYMPTHCIGRLRMCISDGTSHNIHRSVAVPQ